MMFPCRGRGPIPGHHVHEIMRPELAEIMKNNGTQTRDDADHKKIKGPFACVGVGFLF
jgi:hypothetical protein